MKKEKIQNFFGIFTAIYCKLIGSYSETNFVQSILADGRLKNIYCVCKKKEVKKKVQKI